MVRKRTYAKVDYKKFGLDFIEDMEEFVAGQAMEIRKDAPKSPESSGRSGTYARGIVYTENEKKDGFVIHNASPHYRLGHILEYGTESQNAQPHYRTNVNEKGFVEVMRKVEIVEE